MNQATYITGAVVLAFLIFITARGELLLYADLVI